MIDLHAHILPDLDDGAQNLEEAISIAKEMEADGVKQVVATPHFFPSDIHMTPDFVRERVSVLQTVLNKEKINLRVLPGAEVFLTRDIGRKIYKKQVLTINDSRYILVEFCFEQFPLYADDVFYDLGLMGLTPIICHPERYAFFKQRFEEFQSWLEDGVLIQINAGSILGYHGRVIQDHARLLLKNEMVQVIGSDVHSPGKRRGSLKKGLMAVEELFGSKMMNTLINNAQIVVEDQNIAS